MAKKQQFEDPLEGIDPIMEQAYSVSHEKEEEVATPNHGQQRVSTEFDKVADQILAKNPTPVDQSEVLPANPVAENVSIHNIDEHYQDSANPINNPIDTEELLCSDAISLEEGDDSQDITDTINEIGGHLAPTLGAVEITTAVHYVFDAPRDKIVWDTGHQAYAHKVLTGRYSQFPTIRRYKGLSGFLKRSECEKALLNESFDEKEEFYSKVESLNIQIFENDEASSEDDDSETNQVVVEKDGLRPRCTAQWIVPQAAILAQGIETGFSATSCAEQRRDKTDARGASRAAPRPSCRRGSSSSRGRRAGRVSAPCVVRRRSTEKQAPSEIVRRPTRPGRGRGPTARRLGSSCGRGPGRRRATTPPD